MTANPLRAAGNMIHQAALEIGTQQSFRNDDAILRRSILEAGEDPPVARTPDMKALLAVFADAFRSNRPGVGRRDAVQSAREFHVESMEDLGCMRILQPAGSAQRLKLAENYLHGRHGLHGDLNHS